MLPKTVELLTTPLAYAARPLEVQVLCPLLLKGLWQKSLRGTGFIFL